jgi:hypothetical protein
MEKGTWLFLKRRGGLTRNGGDRRTHWGGSAADAAVGVAENIPMALRLLLHPPTIRLPARPPCPSRFAHPVAFRCVVPSPTNAVTLRATAPCGISPSRAGASLAICRYGLGEVCSLTVILPTQETLYVVAGIVRWVRGQEYGAETLVIDDESREDMEQYICQRVEDKWSEFRARRTARPRKHEVDSDF